jgi:hypothetical protein
MLPINRQAIMARFISVLAGGVGHVQVPASHWMVSSEGYRAGLVAVVRKYFCLCSESNPNSLLVQSCHCTE